MESAFLYNGKYYLLPPDCGSVEQLRERHGDGKPFAVTELVEKKCIAPYFVREHAKARKLRLKAGEPVFPCQVECMSMAQYNLRLRQIIPGHCAGCPGFGALTEKDSSLIGHHEEISLDDVCIARLCRTSQCPEEYAPMSKWMGRTVKEFGKLGLEEIIDRGDLDIAGAEFAGMVEQTCLEPMPTVYCVRREDGKYGLYCSSVLEETNGLLLEILMMRLQKKYRKTWDFFNYIPRGFYPPEACRPVGLDVVVVEELATPPCLSLTVYGPPDSTMGQYLWLCGLVGEDRLNQGCIDIHFCSDLEAEGKSLLPAEALPEILEQVLSIQGLQNEGDCAYPSRRVIFSEVDSAEQPDTEDPVVMEQFFAAHTVVTVSRSAALYGLVHVPLADGRQVGSIWEEYDMAGLQSLPVVQFAFEGGLSTPLKPSAGELEERMAPINGLLRNLETDGLAVRAVMTYDFNRTVVTALVLDLNEFLTRVRYLSPMFAETPGVMTILTKSGTNGGRFRLGWKLEQLATEQQVRAALAPNEA